MIAFQSNLLLPTYHRQKFAFGQFGRIVGQLVIRCFAIDKNLAFQLETGIVGKQSGADVIIVAHLHKQVRTALLAETAFRPFGRVVTADVLAAADCECFGC